MKTKFYGLLLFPALVALAVSCSKKDSPAAVAVVPAPVIKSFFPVEDSVGAIVTIVGANFGNSVAENEVKFNAVTATLLSATKDTLRAKVPVGASTGKITLKT